MVAKRSKALSQIQVWIPLKALLQINTQTEKVVNKVLWIPKEYNIDCPDSETACLAIQIAGPRVACHLWYEPN